MADRFPIQVMINHNEPSGRWREKEEEEDEEEGRRREDEEEEDEEEGKREEVASI